LDSNATRVALRYFSIIEVYSRVSLGPKTRSKSNRVDMQTKAVIISIVLFVTEIHTLIYEMSRIILWSYFVRVFSIVAM